MLKGNLTMPLQEKASKDTIKSEPLQKYRSSISKKQNQPCKENKRNTFAKIPSPSI